MMFLFVGLKIVEIGIMIVVFVVIYVFVIQGVDVIKVEDIECGDELCYFGSCKNGMSGWFVNVNDGK